MLVLHETRSEATHRALVLVMAPNLPELRSDSVFFFLARINTGFALAEKYQNRDLTNYLELQAAPAPPLWLSSVGGSIRGAHNFL